MNSPFENTNSIYTPEEISNILDLAETLQSIHNRLIKEGVNVDEFITLFTELENNRRI
jgi:hypothetical protein